MKILLRSLLSFFTVLFLTNCGNENTSENTKNEKLYIVATTGMIGDVVQNIVGDGAEVEFLMGPGVDPHTYKAKKSDLDKIREANVVFFNGIHLEAKMADVLSKLANKKPVIAVGEIIPKEDLRILEGTKNEIDPHIWLDVSIWILITEHIRDELVKIDEKNADLYKENAEKYLSELKALHEKVQSEIGSIPKEQRIIITAHDALGYFGKAYDIEVKGLQGTSTATEFGVKDITNLVDFIVERKIKAVFIETFISEKSLQAVIDGCAEKGHEVRIAGTLYTDAVGEAGTPEATYIGMIESNLKTIVSALK